MVVQCNRQRDTKGDEVAAVTQSSNSLARNEARPNKGLIVAPAKAGV